MITTPVDTPVTTPPVPTVAIEGTVLLHTPPAVASDNVVVVPIHTLTGPDGVMAAGVGLTVTVVKAVQGPIA